ncbi:hypothetical protein [Thalassobellus citreus]|uniref:hypothetical protein n=1 Tax=Thalassobellus citreus TaxID=3367752 RepID=UPI0037A43A9E
MNTINSLLQKIATAKHLDFGTIFSGSIELFKKTWVQGLLLQVFTLIVMIPLIVVLYIPLIGMIIAQQENGYADSEAFNSFFTGMSVLYVLFVVVGVFVLGAISIALQASFFRIMKSLDYNEQVATSDFFYFVKGKYLSKVFVLMLISILIAIPSALLCYIPLIYMMVPLSFFVVIFAFNPGLSIGDIVKVSFSLGNKKWGITIGLLIVSYVCMMVLTMLTCGLGGLVLQPFLFHPLYLIYKNVIGFDEKDAIDEIGQISE